MTQIRSLFRGDRPIDRPIEKVIDYAAADDDRLEAEVGEYEVTENVEQQLRRLVEFLSEALKGGKADEIGVWVSGFYGSGKSSFTKYLGLALQSGREVKGRPFRQLLNERIAGPDVKAALNSLVAANKIAVIMVDLGTDQLVESTTESVTNVLWAKVIREVGFSARVPRLARIEMLLERSGKLAAFEAAYRDRYGEPWLEIHNDPILGPLRAAELIPTFLPDFPTRESFINFKLEESTQLKEQVAEMLNLLKQRRNCDAVLFLLDEAGQYVAPRPELILNLDGLARSLKEAGRGKAWIVATGQQTLAELIERAINSPDLGRLKDRFPIGVHLDANDIHEITYKRLLRKSGTGEAELRRLWGLHGQATITHTRLVDTKVYGRDPDIESFVKYYPLLPHHFELLIQLIQELASARGGLGLRSAIRIVQDLLVDSSRTLPPGVRPVADRENGTLVTVTDIYDTLSQDIAKVRPDLVSAVRRVAQMFPGDTISNEVAKAVAVLQLIDRFPRTAENVAALLYGALGRPGMLADVESSVRQLLANQEARLIDDPEAGGLRFVSDRIGALRMERGRYAPTSQELAAVRARVAREVFEPQPSVQLLNRKRVSAGIRWGRPVIADGDLEFALEPHDPASSEERRIALALRSTEVGKRDEMFWAFSLPTEFEDLAAQVVRSEHVVSSSHEVNVETEVAQYIRAEKRRGDVDRTRLHRILEDALVSGTIIWRGLRFPAGEHGTAAVTAANAVLLRAASEKYSKFHLAAERVSTDLASKFLGVDDLSRLPADLDPLKLVASRNGKHAVNLTHPTLAEVQRAFQERLGTEQSGRLQGATIQDLFAAEPFGWQKDITRYLFAALLVAGVIEIHTAGDIIKVRGQKAQSAFKGTLEFNRMGVALRDSRPPQAAVQHAAETLSRILARDVWPSEDKISDAVRAAIPRLVEELSPLSRLLRVLGLAGSERAERIVSSLTAVAEGDADDATARLSELSGSLPADIEWARSAVRALNDDGVDAIRQARRQLEGLSNLRVVFGAKVGESEPQEVEAALLDALASESIGDRLSDVRVGIAALQTNIEDRRRMIRSDIENRGRAAQRRLEALPQWSRLSDIERTGVIRELTEGPEQDPAADPLTALQSALAQLGRLDTVEIEMARRVRELGDTPADPGATVISAGDLIQAATLRSPDELDAWLDRLREKLLPLFPGEIVIRPTEEH